MHSARSTGRTCRPSGIPSKCRFVKPLLAFLAAQMDFIFFLYGLAFMFLGAVCFAVARIREPKSSWMPLGLFGFAHGAGEWLDLSALVVPDTAVFTLVRTAVMTASFLFLLEFARQKAIRFGLKPLEGPPLYTALILLVMLGGIVGGVPMAGAFARYGIGFFAAMGAASVFAAHARGLSGTAKGLALVAAARICALCRRRRGYRSGSTILAGKRIQPFVVFSGHGNSNPAGPRTAGLRAGVVGLDDLGPTADRGDLLGALRGLSAPAVHRDAGGEW